MLDFVAEAARDAGLEDYRVSSTSAPAAARRSSTCTGTSWVAKISGMPANDA